MFVAIVSSRVLAGLAGLALDFTPTKVVQMALALEFAGLGLYLLRSSLADDAARIFGLLLIAAASPWTADALASLLTVSGQPSVLRLMSALRPDAFIPILLWEFSREFGRDLGSTTDRALAMARRPLLVLSILLAAQVLWNAWLTDFAAVSPRWPTLFVATFAGFIALGAKLRQSSPRERARGRVLVYGFILACAPIASVVLLEALFPAVDRFTAAGTFGNSLVGGLILGSLALAPPVAGYGILVSRALILRAEVAHASRMMLVRIAKTGVWLVPALATATFAIRMRDETLRALATDLRHALGVALIAGTWVLAAIVSKALATHFARSADRDRTGLLRFVAQTQQAGDLEQLQVATQRFLGEAGDVDHCLVLVADSDGRLGSPIGLARPIDCDSAVVRMVEAEGALFDLTESAAARRLPEDGRNWLIDTGADAVVALRNGAGDLKGALCVGSTRNGLPFTGRHREFVGAVAQALEPAIERLTGPAVAPLFLRQAPQGFECQRCGVITDNTADTCSCGGTLLPSLPTTLQGRYRFIRRLGAGAYGVTYLALDLELDRQLAVKTLPSLDLSSLARIRREARAMALLEHRGVATLFGLEFWDGRPLLLMEYMAGGTLADRLRQRPLSIEEWCRLAMGLVEALEYLHQRQVFHGDIAARNVAFDSDGHAKLIDFGLARRGNPAPGQRVAEATDVVALFELLSSCQPGVFDVENNNGARPITLERLKSEVLGATKYSRH